jgi:2-C-methyl-D-erythritol 4-phosphate cytidylyltransferase
MSVSSSNASSPERMTVAAIVVAGGSGQRMGSVRKQYLDLLGEPILLRALRPFLAHPAIDFVVVVVPADDVGDPPRWLAALPVEIVAGGVERGDSVWNGLERTPAGTELVLIHDGARPFVTREVIDRVLAQSAHGGAVAAVAATDTIKEVDAERRILRTLPRARIWQAQTPQGFPLQSLRSAYERARAEGWTETDDAALFERCGHAVIVVEGDRDNLKITLPSDLPIAEAIARRAGNGAAASALRQP